MRLGIRDQKVLAAFVDKKSLDGHKLWTDGKRVDGHWLGGARIAEWTSDGIAFNDLGSRAAQSVQRAILHHAAPNQIYEAGAAFARGAGYYKRSPRRRR